MFSESFCFYLLCVLNGYFAYLQQANGNEISSSSTGATESRSKAYFFFYLPTYPRDCNEAREQFSGKNSSGVFVIKPDGYPDPFEVYCDGFESGGWTVFMRRFDGSLVFKRNWMGYKEGFGFLSSEFWLGNEKLSFLTNQRRYELRIDLMKSNGTMAFVTYSYFRVNDEWGNYSLVSVWYTNGNTDFLIPTCPNNMIYTNCSCERTCEAPTICQNNCQEAKSCICPDGFFKRGRDCVAREDCECYSTTAGKVIPVGESYIDNQCSERCSCSESGLACSNYGCDSNARCTSTNEGGRCACNTGFVGDGLDCGCRAGYLVDRSRCRRPRDCDEVPSVEGYSGSGLYYIYPSNWEEFQVYCNISEGRWTVFQRRTPGSNRDFHLLWNSYKTGFGELNEDFWLGNDNIHYLTSQRNYQLRIDIIDSDNRHYRALYNGFRIANEGNKYRMTVLGRYSGNAGYDAMRDHLNQPFSTRDRDNDDWDGSDCSHRRFSRCDNFDRGSNCATINDGAWWYKHRGRATAPGGCDRLTRTLRCCDRSCNSCGSYAFTCAFANLNGKRRGKSGQTIFWHGLSGNDCEIKFTEMKIRPLS